MIKFFIWLFLTIFLSGLYIFCNHFGIGNTPSTPIPLENINHYLPGILVISGIGAYVFLKIIKKK
jgi:hypothetical protein